MNAVQLSCLFCDDIRMENTGKLMLIGVYGSEIIFPALPAQLSRLCVYFIAKIPKEIRFESDAIFEIKLNGSMMFSSAIPTSDIPGIGSDVGPAYGIGDALGNRLDGQVAFSLSVEEPSILTTHITINGIETQGDRIRIIDSDTFNRYNNDNT